jgi:hypothetical protein
MHGFGLTKGIEGRTRNHLERLRNAECTFVPIGPHAPDGVYVRDPFGVIFDVVERPASAFEPRAG